MSSSDRHNQHHGSSPPPGACPPFEVLSAYFDGELSSDKTHEMASHLPGCQDCQATLHDLSLIRNALAETSPAPNRRSFRLSPELANDPVRLMDRNPRPRNSFPLYPVFASVAALLLVVLLAADLLSDRDGTGTIGSNPDDEILLINGTAFSEDDSEGQFDAASAEDMNGGNAEGQIASEDASDRGLFTTLRVAWLLALGAFLCALVLLYRDRSTRNPKEKH